MKKNSHKAGVYKMTQINEYTEDQYLLLSGIQHFAFCRRQWALIYIEQQWLENERTTDGKILHERCHDVLQNETRRDLLIIRGLRVESRRLGVTGACDVVEFRKDEQGVPLFGQDGTWSVTPVEYKKGVSKVCDADRLQLCLQGECLEEMLACTVPQGFLYYGETKRRECVLFTDELRQEAAGLLQEMHSYMERGYTPKVKPSKSCKACSIANICLPKLCGNLSATDYVRNALSE